MGSLAEFKQHLVEKELISKLDYIKIKTLNESANLGEKLLDGSLLDPVMVGKEMASFLGLGYVDTVSQIEMSDYLYSLDVYTAKNLSVVPVRLTDYTEAIIIANPFNECVQDYITKWYKEEQKDFTLLVSSKPIINSFYGRFSNIVDDIIKGTISIETRDEIKLLLRKIILDASAERVSDIRIYLQSNSGGVTFRKSGDLYKYLELSLDKARRLQSSVINDDYTTFTEMNRKKPRVGKMRINLDGEWYELRVNIIPTVFGSDINMRFIYIDYMDFDCLGLSKEAQNKLLSCTSLRNGMILFTGPVGTGKSTTLYSVIERLKQDKTICTAEDPVEHRIEGAVQVQIDKDNTYSMAIQSFLRHDPDIIVIGEIRSPEIAKEVFTAVETGHLLLSTLHCKSVLSVFSRLRDLGITSTSMVENIKCIVNQRLIKKITGERTLVVEVLVMDNNISQLILANSPMTLLQESLTEDNYVSMSEELELKLEAGEVAKEEVLKFLTVEGIT